MKLEAQTTPQSRQIHLLLMMLASEDRGTATHCHHVTHYLPLLGPLPLLLMLLPLLPLLLLLLLLLFFLLLLLLLLLLVLPCRCRCCFC